MAFKNVLSKLFSALFRTVQGPFVVGSFVVCTAPSSIYWEIVFVAQLPSEG